MIGRRASRPGRWDDLLSTTVAAVMVLVALLAWAPFVADRAGQALELSVVVAVVALSGWALRSLGTPGAVVPLGQLVAVLVWSTGRWVPDAAVGGWIPTVESVTALADELRAGVAAAQQYAAPVPAEVTELVVLLALAGAACALLVDLFVGTWRIVPLSGLPLLLIFTVPAGLIGAAVPWWVFTVAAVGYLFLIAREQARGVRQWGRAVRTAGPASVIDRVVGTARPGATARRIGVLTTGLALLAPFVVPVLADGLPGGVVGRGGGGDTVEISNPMIDLRRDLNRGQDLDLVRVTTDGPAPSYLRLAVLDEYDGEAWRPLERQIPADQRVGGALPRPGGLASSTPTSTRVMQLATSPSFDSVWLPLPYPAAAARIDGDWRYDRATLDVVSADPDQPTRNLDYTAQALEVGYDAETLAEAPSPRRAVTDRYLQLPDDLPDVVRDFADQAVGAADTDWERAVRLQNWFQDPERFSYSLEQAPASADGEDLVRFLTPGPEGRIGYCEQFAASMALMARSLGIPARVAVGFLRPESTGPRTWTFSAHDMHAWPEIFLEGSGWVRFEPTPVSHTAAVPPYTRGADAPEPQLPDAAPTTGPDDLPAPSAGPDLPDAVDAPDAVDTSTESDSGAALWWVLLVLLVVVALALVPRGLRRVRSARRRRLAADDAARAEAVWAEVRDLAVDVGVRWEDGESPRVTGRRLRGILHDPEADPRACPHPDGVGAAREAAAAMDRIVLAVERARYSPSPVDAGGLGSDLDRVATALFAAVGPRARRRATWLPRSLWRRAAGVDGWIDRWDGSADDAGADRMAAAVERETTDA